MKKAKTDKGWAGHKLFGYTFSERDIRTPEDKYQDKVLENLEKKHEHDERSKHKPKRAKDTKRARGTNKHTIKCSEDGESYKDREPKKDIRTETE